MITGTREPDANTIHLLKFALNWTAFSPITSPTPLLLQGAARGVDAEGKRIWREWGLKDKPFEADWDKYGKPAGGIRNQEMVDEGPEICLAFPGPQSIGTWDAVRRAKKAGILTFVLTDKDSMYKLYHYTILNPGVSLD
jgi:hypothetical protein